MSSGAKKNKKHSQLPPGWKLVSRIEYERGPIQAEYRHESGVLLEIIPRVPYRQPWAVSEYFIELIDTDRTYIAPSKRINYFHVAWEIALEKMRIISEKRSKS